MPFPLGKPVLALVFVSLFTCAAVLFRSPPQKADLTLWVFADSHARMYRDEVARIDPSRKSSLLERFQEQTGHTVRMELIATQALDIRLISLFMSNDIGNRGPDLAEIEISSIGKFFRVPNDEVGFLPLNDYLQKSGWMNRIVRTRFTPWSKGATIFGIPDDLHPCAISYRKDLFDEAGVDLESATTWKEFQIHCLQFQEYWHRQGRDRAAIGFSSASSDQLMILLQQEHVNLIDPDLGIHIADQKVLATLVWYAQAVAGQRQIGADFNPAPGQNVRDLANGDICAMMTPDWQVGYIRQYAPDLAGKLHMIPLPRFAYDDAPTASWGGTMIGITRNCKHPDLAWKLIETLYLDRAAVRIRQQSTNILPPIPEYWSDPVYQQPDPLFAGQKVDQLFIKLAVDLPPRYMTAYTITAQTILSVILNRAVSHVQNHGLVGLEEACRQWLTDAGGNLKEMIALDQTGG